MPMLRAPVPVGGYISRVRFSSVDRRLSEACLATFVCPSIVLVSSSSSLLLLSSTTVSSSSSSSQSRLRFQLRSLRRRLSSALSSGVFGFSLVVLTAGQDWKADRGLNSLILVPNMLENWLQLGSSSQDCFGNCSLWETMFSFGVCGYPSNELLLLDFTERIIWKSKLNF